MQIVGNEVYIMYQSEVMTVEAVSEEASLNGIPTVREVLMPPFHASAISLCCPLCTNVCPLLRLPTVDPIVIY